MATTIDPTALFFGAPASLTVGGTEVGATITPPKVTVEETQYAPDFQGAGGPVKGAVFVTKAKAQIEFDVNELTASKMAWALPGSTSSSGAGSAVGGGGAFSTTLGADSAIGDTLVELASTASPLAVGQFLKFGTGAGAEYGEVKAIIDPAVELVEALRKAHTSGDAVVRTVDADVTTTTMRIGRIDTSVFADVILDGVGVDGRHLVVTVTDALSDGKMTSEFSDSAVAGVHCVMTGYYDPADPTLVPISIAVG
jgi:hypothetical protein